MKRITALKPFLSKYLIDSTTVPGRIVDLFFILLNVIFCALFVLETYSSSAVTKSVVFKIDVVLIIIFIIEYALRFYLADHKLRHFFHIHSMIDLISILPTISLLIFPLFNMSVNLWFMKLIRIIKVFRIFRFLRITADEKFFFGSVTHHLLKVLRLVLTIVIIFFIASGIFFYLENTVNDKIQTYGDAFYFTIVSLTTVGFGDITPVSSAGRWVTMIMIVSSIIFIPWQASQIIKEWLLMSSKVTVICKQCGLKYHDKDASHCKHCGHIIYQEFEGKL